MIETNQHNKRTTGQAGGKREGGRRLEENEEKGSSQILLDVDKKTRILLEGFRDLEGTKIKDFACQKVERKIERKPRENKKKIIKIFTGWR